MFLDNKYYRWYQMICENARLRVLPTVTYVERHHIVPKSMGGSDETANIVKLTAREHYVVHLLLIKCVTAENKYKMMRAINWMHTKKRMAQFTSRGYQQKIVTMAGFKDSDETKERKKAACAIRSVDTAYLKNLSASLKGRKFSEEHIAALSKSRIDNKTFAGSNNPMFGVTPTWSIFINNHPFARKVVFNGVEYPSVLKLIQETGMQRGAAHQLAKSQEKMKLIDTQKFKLEPPNPIVFTIKKGLTYEQALRACAYKESYGACSTFKYDPSTGKSLWS